MDINSQDVIGLVSGKATPISFAFNVRDVKNVQRNQYVLAVDSNDQRKILAHIKNITVSGSEVVADCEVLGEVVDGRLIPPKRPISIGSKVIKPESELLAEILARVPKDSRLLLGRVYTQRDLVPVYFNPEDFARHMVIVATTGGGKSYSISVIIEELLKLAEKGREDFAIVVFDVHNEYGGLAVPNRFPDQVEKLKQYGLEPRGFEDRLMIFDWEENRIRLKDDFDPERILFLYSVKELRFALILKEIIGDEEKLPLNELLLRLEVSDLHHQTKQALITRIRALKELGLFDKNAPDFAETLEPGKVTVIRLANAPLGDYGVRFVVADILRNIFTIAKARKLGFNVLVIVDEAHLFAPKKGKIDAVRDVIERVSREGRKYGVWLVLATQSPRDLSDTVVINCSSMLALKMLRKDIAEFARIFDIPKEIANILVDLPPGRGYLKAPSLTLPVLLEVRPRMSSEIKGTPEEIAEIEEKIKEIARKTKRYLEEKLKAKIEEQVSVPKEEEIKPKEEEIAPKMEEVKGVPEVAPKGEPRPEVVLEEAPKEPEEEKKVESKAVAKVKEKKKKAKRQEVISVDVLDDVIEFVVNYGMGARVLLKALLTEGYMNIKEALSMVDERVLDALILMGVIEKRKNILILSLDKYLQRILGRKLSSSEYKLYRKRLLSRL